MGVFEGIGKVLLGHIVKGGVMGEAVACAVPQFLRSLVMGVPQVFRRIIGILFGIAPGGGDARRDRVGFGGGGNDQSGLGQGQLGFRKPQLQSRIHTGLDDLRRLGISKPHILAGAGQKPPGC